MKHFHNAECIRFDPQCQLRQTLTADFLFEQPQQIPKFFCVNLVCGQVNIPSHNVLPADLQGELQALHLIRFLLTRYRYLQITAQLF